MIVPSVPSPRTGPPQRTRGTVRPPLWLRWVLSLAVAAGVVAALVLFVQSHSSDAPAPESQAAVAEQSRESEILVAQDQAPHSVRFRPGAPATQALERAINARMNFLIAHQVLDGPVQSSKCTPTSRRSETRLGFSCTVLAANVNYPFLGVVDVRSGQLTYCKRDPAPIPSENVPLSPRCLA